MITTIPKGLATRLFIASPYFFQTGQSVAGNNNATFFFQTSANQLLLGQTNSQSTYHDTYANIYGAHRVHGLRVQYTASMVEGTFRGIIMGHYWSNTTTVPSTVENAMAQPGAKYQYLCMDKSSRTAKTFNKPNNVIGVSKVEYITDIAYQANVGSNPARMGYLVIWLYNNSSTAAFVQIMAKVTPYVEYFQPKLTINT